MKIRLFLVLSLLVAIPVNGMAQFDGGYTYKYSFGRLIDKDGCTLSDENALKILGYMEGSEYYFTRNYYKAGIVMMCVGPIVIVGGNYFKNKVLTKSINIAADGTVTYVVTKNYQFDRLGNILLGAGIASSAVGLTVWLVNRYKLVSIAKRYESSKGVAFSFSSSIDGLGMVLNF